MLLKSLEMDLSGSFANAVVVGVSINGASGPAILDVVTSTRPLRTSFRIFSAVSIVFDGPYGNALLRIPSGGIPWIWGNAPRVWIE